MLSDQLLHFVIIPHTLSITLFPYPTLFRSRRRRRRARSPPAADRRLERRASRPPRCSGHRSSDRKSTRLNSSHLVISYAVFCLRNKTEFDAEHPPASPCEFI